MKIAVTDACIFIDLIELKIIAEFFSLKLEIHTTIDVLNELFSDHQQILKAYESGSRLTIHNLKEYQITEIKEMAFPKSLSTQDQSVIYLASKLDAILLSSDKVARNHAGRLSIEYHGMFWIFDRLVEENCIIPSKAIEKLHQMVQTNIIYRNNIKLLKEAESRIKQWSSSNL